MFFRDAERCFFSFNFSSPGDFTATILFLLFLGKIARNGSVCVLRAIAAGLCSLGDPLYSMRLLMTVLPVLTLVERLQLV